MFTGIIKEVGIVQNLQKKAGITTLEVKCRQLKMRPGDSVSVNGACLTITEKTSSGFKAQVVPETLELTNLGGLKAGAQVNLEPSMKISDQINGHFVTGHVDGVSKIIKIKKTAGESAYLTFGLPKKMRPFVAKKGSVALNGVSLTVAVVNAENFNVAVIPFTAKRTNLGGLKIGDFVNIEADLIARYVHNRQRA